MHCWQCGQMIQGARCTCGANDTVRPKPKTEYAITLRHVYDVYGQKALLDDPSFFRRILGDAFHDDAGLRNSMRTAIDHGIGGAIKALAQRGANMTEAGATLRTELKTAGVAPMDIDILVDCLCDMVGFPAVSSANTAQPIQDAPPPQCPEQYRRTVFTASEQPVEQRRSSVPSNTEKIRQAEQCKPVPKAREQTEAPRAIISIANVSLTNATMGVRYFNQGVSKIGVLVVRTDGVAYHQYAKGAGTVPVSALLGSGKKTIFRDACNADPDIFIPLSAIKEVLVQSFMGSHDLTIVLHDGMRLRMVNRIDLAKKQAVEDIANAINGLLAKQNRN